MRGEAELKDLETRVREAQIRTDQLSATAAHRPGAPERVSHLRARAMEVAVKVQAFREAEPAMRDRMRESLYRLLDEYVAMVDAAESSVYAS